MQRRRRLRRLRSSTLEEFDVTECDYRDLRDEHDEVESLLKDAYEIMRGDPSLEEDAEPWKLLMLRLKARFEAER